MTGDAPSKPLVLLAAMLALALAGCESQPTPTSPETAPTDAAETTLARPADTTTSTLSEPNLTTIVGVVESGRQLDDGWWEYRLASGKVFSKAPGSDLPCGIWLGSGATVEECGLVALVDNAGVASLVEDLEIPRGEDAEVYEPYTDGRPAGILYVSDVAEFTDTRVVTAEGFPFSMSRGVVRECDPRESPTPYGYTLLLDLETAEVLHFGCLATA